jgi:hypothetical protein
MWNVKNKSDTTNSRVNWNNFKIILNVPEQCTWKTRNRGITDNSHIGYRAHTAEGTNVKGRNV